jgi:uncharacterized protein YkwD
MAVLTRKEASKHPAGGAWRGMARPLVLAILALATTTATAAQPGVAHDAQELLTLINNLRAAPPACQGRRASPVPPLSPQRTLASVRIGPGAFLEQLMGTAGYPVSRVQVIDINGALDATSAMALIQERYCKALLSKEFSAIGVRHEGAAWQIVLAQPFVPEPLPDWPDAGQAILAAVNAARATDRMCGDQHFAAAGPLAWNDALAKAALVHSQDMALHHFLQHTGSDGSGVADRATRAGYKWQRVGENIASGLRSPQDAVAGWLNSPGHCANIMSAGFTEMGAAYFIHPESKTGLAYWTQDFGSPR